MASVTPEVEAAITELQAAYPDHAIEMEPDGQGGAYVIVHDLQLGSHYRPERSWFGFQVIFQYPHADVYPHFMDSSLERVDDTPLGQGFQRTSWRGQPVTQVSRRSKHWNPVEDTAALKLAKVVQWVSQQ